MGSRFASPNVQPPAFLAQFPCPPCFGERDWEAWLRQHHQQARGAELKALQRGKAPNHCEDCERGSEHQLYAVLRGVCIPIVAVTGAAESTEKESTL